MNLLVKIMAACGVIAFIVGAVMRIMDVGKILNAPPEAWWRASMSFLTVGILFVLMEIRDLQRKS